MCEKVVANGGPGASLRARMAIERREEERRWAIQEGMGEEGRRRGERRQKQCESERDS